MSAAAVQAICTSHKQTFTVHFSPGCVLEFQFTPDTDAAIAYTVNDTPDIESQLSEKWGWTRVKSTISNDVTATLYTPGKTTTMEMTRALLSLSSIHSVEFTTSGWWISKIRIGSTMYKHKQRHPEHFTTRRAGKATRRRHGAN